MKFLFVDDSITRHIAFVKGNNGDTSKVQQRKITNQDLVVDTEKGILTHVYTVAQALFVLENQQEFFDVIFLDHDMDSNKKAKQGMAVAEYICKMPIKLRPKLIYIHSWNVVASERMKKLFDESNIPCKVVRFFCA